MKQEKNITRLEAIKKMGKYSSLTALATYSILTPLAAQEQSGGGFRPGKTDSIWKD